METRQIAGWRYGVVCIIDTLPTTRSTGIAMYGSMLSGGCGMCGRSFSLGCTRLFKKAYHVTVYIAVHRSCTFSEGEGFVDLKCMCSPVWTPPSTRTWLLLLAGSGSDFVWCRKVLLEPVVRYVVLAVNM